jgi:hypothetical protein
MMANYLICLVMVLLLAACAPVSAARALTTTPMGAPGQAVAQAQRPQQSKPRDEIDPWLASLWIDMSMGSQLVGLYNEYAGARDIARADHVSLVDLLDKVEIGHRLVVFKNAADVEELVPRLVGKMDIIGYNLESGPANRPDEQADPVGSIRRVRAVADQYGMQLAFGPDRAFALSHGVQMAPYADFYILQVQRAQTDPATVREFVVPLVAQLRQANPNLLVSVQIRTEGDVMDLADLLLSMKGSIDGVSILTNDETAAVAQELVSELRLPAAEVSATETAAGAAPAEVPATLPSPTPAKTDGGVAALATPTPNVRRAASATPFPVEAPNAANASNSARSLLLLVSLSIMGVIISGVVGTVLIYTFRTTRRR